MMKAARSSSASGDMDRHYGFAHIVHDRRLVMGYKAVLSASGQGSQRVPPRTAYRPHSVAVTNTWYELRLAPGSAV